MHMIKENMEKQLEHCDEAPFIPWPVNDWYCARLRSHHFGYWSDDDWYGLRCCVMLHQKNTLVYPIKKT
jgi:hypothetical protein